MVLTEPVWQQVRDSFDAYVDMDLLGVVFPIMKQTAALIAANAYMMENPALDVFTAVRTAEAALTGNVSATFINALYEAAGLPPPFSGAHHGHAASRESPISSWAKPPCTPRLARDTR